MRVLIIGGGIAGCAAALALHKAGFEPVLHEAHPDGSADIGAFLTLASNGMRALTQIGAERIVADLGFPLTTLSVTDASGAEVANAPLGEHGDPLTRYRCLRRADLGRALQREVHRRGIAIRHGARLAALREDGDGVSARFADGSSATGDLLIGADGLDSTVRSLNTATADAVQPRYAGQQVFYGYTTEAKPGPPQTITMIRGSSVAFGYATSPGGEVFWFARVSGPPLPPDEIARTAPARWRDRLVALLRPDATPAAHVVRATGERLMVTNACDLPAGTAWRTPRTLLIGDAAHAASPATGQGASMALEDAVVLAKALRDEPTITAGLSAYERVRRPRVEHNIAVSAQLTARRTPPPQAPPLTNDELLRQLDWATALPR
jgi:2-polyprenyl-6-methoxyphenol hydroxylase-like FAD-dependent oxidoreductase